MRFCLTEARINVDLVVDLYVHVTYEISGPLLWNCSLGQVKHILQYEQLNKLRFALPLPLAHTILCF